MTVRPLSRADVAAWRHPWCTMGRVVEYRGYSGKIGVDAGPLDL
jgi:hypothetical protein